jgi:hypothetical protein
MLIASDRSGSIIAISLDDADLAPQPGPYHRAAELVFA